jgi:hypothetical protein
MVTGVSAFFYQQMVSTENITDITTITIKNSDLGEINEGETKNYTSSEIANFREAIKIKTTSEPVYLYLSSDLDSNRFSYSTFKINVHYNTVPPSGTGSGIACSISLDFTNSSYIKLDVAGTWIFDLSADMVANSVDSNIHTTVTIIVSARAVM